MADQLLEQFESELGRLRGTAVNDYESTMRGLRAARQLFHEFAAARLEPALNRAAAQRPQATLPDKQDLARWINGELRSLGIAVRCPRTGQPALLRGDPGHRQPAGRFQIQLISAEEARRRTSSFATLEPLQLCGNPERREPLAEYWAERLAPRAGKHRTR
ncbi:MAG: hypothetical protein U0836_27505 [Pirellulales bacterium]